MNLILWLGAATLAVLVLVRPVVADDEIVLFPGGAPGALGDAAKDVPTLTPFLPAPDRATGAAIVICPGGGYQHLAAHEGRDYALFLNESGVTCFVLKYRLASDGYRHPAMLQDATRAVRYVRANAATWKLDPARIGIMGSSAGGHLASTLLTHSSDGDPAAADPVERVSSRPDFGILCYPVITMGPFTHAGSKRGLIGDDAPPELVQLLSNEEQVTNRTPPCFIWHGLDDASVPVENSLMFAAALKKQGVPFDLHIYEQARHGLGLGDRTAPFLNRLPWTTDLLKWLTLRKVISMDQATP